jgi:hypothetical protein
MSAIQKGVKSMSNDDGFLKSSEKQFLKRHWRIMSVFALIITVGAIEAIFVLLWFVATAQSTGLVPAVLGQWSIGYVVTFILHLIFWELLLVGSWILVVVAVVIIRWYQKLPEEERGGKPKRGKREGGDAIGILVGLTWLIVVWLDGRWNLAFQSWTLNNWVYSFLAAVAWDLLIFGIPIALAFIWWFRKEMTKET